MAGQGTTVRRGIKPNDEGYGNTIVIWINRQDMESVRNI